MLKVVLGLLVCINAVFWLWSQNHLAVLGWPVLDTRSGAAKAEAPIDPERIRVTAPGEPDTLPPIATQGIDTAAAPSDWRCWNIGPYAPNAQSRLQAALPLTSPDLRWQVVDSVLPQRWVVVSERSSNTQSLNQLVQQAKAQGLDHRTSETDVLRGRLILGTFINRDLAVKALSNLLDQGWGPLSVMRERPPLPALLLQAHVASDEALSNVQQALAPIAALGFSKAQVLACNAPSPIDEATTPAQSSPSTPSTATGSAPVKP